MHETEGSNHDICWDMFVTITSLCCLNCQFVSENIFQKCTENEFVCKCISYTNLVGNTLNKDSISTAKNSCASSCWPHVVDESEHNAGF